MTETQTLYKLTTPEHLTRGTGGGTLWGRGVTHEATGSGGLCTDGVIHAYEGDPRVALLMNPIHAVISRPVVWLAEGLVTHRDGPLKCGCRSLTTIRVIPKPTMTTEQIIEIAIRCVPDAADDPRWASWALSWLKGKNRTKEMAAGIANIVRCQINRNRCDSQEVVLHAREHAASAAGPVFKSSLWEAASAIAWAWDADPDLNLPAIIRKVCGPLDEHAEEAKR